jgi:Family of unknown function (DUF6262)
MNNKKIEALQHSATQKAAVTASRVELALQKMIKQGQEINFTSVAHSAKVSTAYLYKQPEIRSRIESLRNQQKQRLSTKQPPLASDNSKSVIIQNLREDNKRLRAEIDGLRRINEGLAGRLYQIQLSEDIASRLQIENAQLKTQLSELQQQSSISKADNNKVIPLAKSRGSRSTISPQIQEQLDLLGIQLNSTLTKVIKAAKSSEIVLDAIEAFKEAQACQNIYKPAAWLKYAIEKCWKPNIKN